MPVGDDDAPGGSWSGEDDTMDTMELMKQRHSVRQYTDRAIESEKRQALDAVIEEINGANGLHIQIFYDEPKCFDSFMAHYGKFSGVSNYIALVGPKGDKADETLGFWGEKIVLKAQEMGLNTCWVALTHGRSPAEVSKGEKLGCIIALGYGRTNGYPHKSKDVSEVSNYREGMPDWFLDGVNAALLAPTAVNQQRFFFELLPSGEVKATCGRRAYAKVDLGIARYHFEAVTGRKVLRSP